MMATTKQEVVQRLKDILKDIPGIAAADTLDDLVTDEARKKIPPEVVKQLMFNPEGVAIRWRIAGTDECGVLYLHEQNIPIAGTSPFLHEECLDE